MLKYKGNARDQWIDFKYWCLNWGAILSFVASNPYKVVKALFQYPWIYDLLKVNNLAKRYNEGRTGTQMHMSLMGVNSVTKSVVMFLKMFVYDTKNIIMAQVMIPPEIYQAMGLKWFVAEFFSSIGSMLDQHTPDKYIDLIENNGLPGDTCSYPRITAGMYAAGELPRITSAMIASNLPCDGGMSSYAAIEQGNQVPTYRLDIPYNFKERESILAFVEDLKGMIAFLEERTGRKIDWDKLREVCSRYNRMNELELEKWEMARSDAPPIAGENIWLPHIWNYGIQPGTKASVDLFEKMHVLTKKAYENKEPAVKNMKFRAVLWNPPTFGFPHFWNWMERCWGIATLNDMETFGKFEEMYIDTSTSETMLEGLAKRCLNHVMARHTRGAVENYLPDIWKMVEMFRADLVIVANHIACRPSVSMSGILKEEAQKRGIPICFFDYELMDSRVCSRQGIRDQISNFMFNVMKAKPLDEGLLVIDDDSEW